MSHVAEATKVRAGGRPAFAAPGAERLAVALLLVVAVGAPFLASGFQTFQLTMVLIYAIAILGLNLLSGFTGQFSVGHGAFYAIGAFVTAMLIANWHVPYWAALLIVPVVCFAVGFLFGLPALRLEGHYLALATFALATATPQILKVKGLEPWTHGSAGIILKRLEVPAGLPLTADQWLYALVLLIAVLMFWLARNLVNSHVGRAMMALRDHPIASVAMGVDSALYKTMVFAISALYCGVAGALGALAVRYVSPDSYDLFFSLTLLIGVVIGGLGTIYGALFGGLFVLFLPNIAANFTKSAPWAIQGVLLILCMYVMPFGVMGLIARVRKRLAPRA